MIDPLDDLSIADLAAGLRAAPDLYERAARDPDAYWARWARTLAWKRPFARVVEGEGAQARWFAEGALNASVNALDRHVAAGRGERIAYFFEGEPGDRRAITYGELLGEVRRCASALRALGVGRGDRVALYLPMIPELPIAMLACARIGAIHSVVFAGFAPEALADRIADADARVLITADGGWRRGAALPLKANADAAMDRCPGVRACVVVERTGAPVAMRPGRDVRWSEALADAPDRGEPEVMASEDLLFLLYTSGTTARPKGVMHATGGYLVGAVSSYALVFDPRPEDVYWCTADLGWITGHTYVLYGPLAAGATSVLYEGAPDAPARDRWWEIVARYGVSVFYTAPTAIRAAMKWGDALPARHDLTSLRLLGSVGEPINPEAWRWYRDRIGGGRAPVLDTWWQTETGAIAIAPLPGRTPTPPGSATLPLPGMAAGILDEAGASAEEGYLVLERPWPSALRGVWGDPERYAATYWSRFPGRYLTGDGARRDAAGNVWLLGRLDDVISVSGHRISTAELESVLIEDPRVAESAVVGCADPLTGEATCAFVTLRGEAAGDAETARALRERVATRLGAFTRPKHLVFVADLPKTRSGKILRRLLRDAIEGRAVGDTTTLADPTVMAAVVEAVRATRVEAAP